MKKLIISLAILLMATTAVAGEAGATYSNKWMWRGFMVYDEPVLQSYAKLDIGPVAVQVQHNSDFKFNENDRWDFAGTVNTKLFGLDVEAGYAYYYWPDVSDNGLDLQEVFGTAKLPLTKNITGRYTAVVAWPSKGDSIAESGMLHVAGVDVDVGDFDLFGEITYNDGLSPFGGPTTHDLSHVLAGASIDIPVRKNIFIRPALYYQFSLDDAIHTEDELVLAVGAGLKF